MLGQWHFVLEMVLSEVASSAQSSGYSAGFVWFIFSWNSGQWSDFGLISSHFQLEWSDQRKRWVHSKYTINYVRSTLGNKNFCNSSSEWIQLILDLRLSVDLTWKQRTRQCYIILPFLALTPRPGHALHYIALPSFVINCSFNVRTALWRTDLLTDIVKL